MSTLLAKQLEGETVSTGGNEIASGVAAWVVCDNDLGKCAFVRAKHNREDTIVRGS